MAFHPECQKAVQGDGLICLMLSTCGNQVRASSAWSSGAVTSTTTTQQDGLLCASGSDVVTAECSDVIVKVSDLFVKQHKP